MVRGGIPKPIARANFGARNFQTYLDGAGSGSIQVSSPTAPGKHFPTRDDAGLSLEKVTVQFHG
jgi:hypothetical protein